MRPPPADYIDTLLKAIVGIKIEIVRLVGKVKLSQNKEERDRLGAADALETRGQRVLAQAMRTALDS